ncbi:hypothetical protein [Amycolatopsis sp. 195334CR]|uniref:hypothetical protein n=1 Tax=Amycolatopsis sp. 195334CR TaxID=2814588 RepID=UPI001A8E910C|nr:hypothetical protein [Amycolatopsis sp. 195334CR]MBN6040029.1 hypothetical protein [Amycolatopsis sp. 195334CR]
MQVPEAGQSAGGQPLRRPGTRLQPEAGTAEFFAFVGEALEQFDSWGETTDAETQEADRARARLARLGDDAELFERLAAQNFAGPEYELFRAELASYALPVLRSFIRRKVIYPMCRRAHRPVAATDAMRERLAHDVNDRLELALETVARGLRLFERYALLGRRWSPEHGASLKTFFVGACVRSFSAAFRCWAAEHEPHGVRVLPMDTVPDCGAHDDPAENIVSMQRVNDHLNGMKPLVRQVAARVALFAETFEEAGRAHGLSARAVEGHLYRHRKEAHRRGKRKRGGA